MKFLFALVALSIVSTVLGQSCSSPDELEECVYKSAWMMNRGAQLPATIDEMKTHCDNAQKSMTCLISFNERCVTGPPQVSLKRIYNTVQRGVNDRCGDETKLQEFVNNLACLRDDSKMEMVRQCFDKHIRHLEQIIDIAPPQRTGPLCCTTKFFYGCVKGVINDQCSDEVSDYFENLLNEYKDELLIAMCDKFSDMGKCAANLPAPIWGPMKTVIDSTEKITHNYRTTIPVMIRLLEPFLKKN